ncbi:MAG: 30S ribosomal protein S1, partial [Gammaproteobacteria bacterium]|nr:30S ribosomal protein S1 [Gammaproteobacteria bacterium]
AGEEVEAKFIGLDRKNRTINLSIKAREAHEEAETMQEYNAGQSSGSGTSLGDILKAKITGKTDSEGDS